VEASGDYTRPSAPEPAEAAPEEKAREEGSLLGDIQLDWLAAMKDWVRIKPGKDAPVLKIEFHSVPDTRAVKLDVQMAGDSFGWRDQRWDSIGVSLAATFGGEPTPISIERIEIGHGGRTAKLVGSVDLKKNVAHVSEFKSGVDILALARAFGGEAATKGLAPMTTSGQWDISGTGRIRMDEPMASEWRGHVALAGDVTYAEQQTRVTLHQPRFSLDFAKKVVTLSDFKAGLWDGQLELPATTLHPGEGESKPTFQTRVNLANARLEAISHSFGAGSNQPGVVNANWKGGGGFDLPSIAGGGTVSIQQAEFFRIPLLGPLHLVFDQLTPGFGKDVASSLTASHSLGNGILSIRNLKLDSKFTRLEANGDVNLTSNHAHLTAKAKLQGIVGLATALLSALLEVEGEGPISDVKWKLKSLPAGLLVKGAVDVVGKTGGVVLDGAEGAVNITTDAATGTVKGAGKAVKEILKIPGRLLPGGKKD
jgi:hypothetical protein